MRPRRLAAMLVLSAAAVAILVGLTTSGGSTTSASANTRASTVQGTAPVRQAQGQHSGTKPAPSTGTVRLATTRVAGVSETILVTGKGLPLYIYGPDTSTMSMVSGELAALWPPLTAGTPSAPGLPGSLATVATSSGRQVTYNGHFLYTFVGDPPGVVTGQGVQNFSVATPSMPAIRTPSRAPGNPPMVGSTGYGPGY